MKLLAYTMNVDFDTNKLPTFKYDYFKCYDEYPNWLKRDHFNMLNRTGLVYIEKSFLERVDSFNEMITEKFEDFEYAGGIFLIDMENLKSAEAKDAFEEIRKDKSFAPIFRDLKIRKILKD